MKGGLNKMGRPMKQKNVLKKFGVKLDFGGFLKRSKSKRRKNPFK